MNTKAKILYVHPSLKVGGAENLRLLSLFYIKDKYDVSVCCIEARGSVAENIERLGIKVDCLGKPISRLNFSTTRALFRYISKYPFDIVQSSLSGANYHTRIAAKLAKIPITIIEEHSDYERYNPRLGTLFRLINHYMFNTVDKILTCSREVAEYLSRTEKISLDNYFVLPDAIDIKRFENISSTSGFRDELGISGREKVIVSVASLRSVKGHIYLLQAFNELVKDFSDLKLVLVGRGPLRNQLEKFVRRHRLKEKVIFAGLREDVPEILAASDILVLTSIHEGFGINLIEAMYMGLPCVATAVGGVPEVIKDGETGILIPPADPQALTGAIKRLLNQPDLAKKYGQAGKRRVLENFTAEKYIEKLDNLYAELLKKAKLR